MKTGIRKFFIVLTAAAVFGGAAAAEDAVPVEVVVQEESQWEKFKEGAVIAGEAVVQGTKNTAGKVADGGRRAGAAIAGKYDDAKEYVQEKMEE